MSKQNLDEDYKNEDFSSLPKSMEELLKNNPKQNIQNPAEIYNHTDPDKESQYPTEIIDLPSHGLVYPSSNPLSIGTIEMKYMTAKEEDILTSQNLVRKGVVIDKLLRSMIVSRINYDDLLLGDKNAIIVAARILAYGGDYPVEQKCPSCGEINHFSIKLTEFDDKEINYDLLNKDNIYDYILPNSKIPITFKLLTIADDKNVDAELRGLKKIQDTSKNKSNIDPEFSTRLKYIITSVNGNTDLKIVRLFVESMLSKDTFEFRKHLAKMTPNLDMSYLFECSECDYTTRLTMPMTTEFFWPKSDV